MDDNISRQAALDALGEKPLAWMESEYAQGLQNQWVCDVNALKALPSAQPEHLRDDDFEAIRIHLNAYKERLCNQHRYAEAEEYQQLIDRFMSFAEAQPQIIRCKDCRYWQDNNGGYPHDECRWNKDETPDEDDYCSYGERREVSE